jgi:hypothetical protein
VIYSYPRFTPEEFITTFDEVANKINTFSVYEDVNYFCILPVKFFLEFATNFILFKKFSSFLRGIELYATESKEIELVIKKAKSNANWYVLNAKSLANWAKSSSEGIKNLRYFKRIKFSLIVENNI